jgi:hypothetical protein
MLDGLDDGWQARDGIRSKAPTLDPGDQSWLPVEDWSHARPESAGKRLTTEASKGQESQQLNTDGTVELGASRAVEYEGVELCWDRQNLPTGLQRSNSQARRECAMCVEGGIVRDWPEGFGGGSYHGTHMGV